MFEIFTIESSSYIAGFSFNFVTNEVKIETRIIRETIELEELIKYLANLEIYNSYNYKPDYLSVIEFKYGAYTLFCNKKILFNFDSDEQSQNYYELTMTLSNISKRLNLLKRYINA